LSDSRHLIDAESTQEKLGGEDKGMNPHELMEAALVGVHAADHADVRQTQRLGYRLKQKSESNLFQKEKKW